MPEQYTFTDADGKIFTADPRSILTELAEWLQRRHGGIGINAGLVTSKLVGDVVATLEVRPVTVDSEAETERCPNVDPTAR